MARALPPYSAGTLTQHRACAENSPTEDAEETETTSEVNRSVNQVAEVRKEKFK